MGKIKNNIQFRALYPWWRPFSIQ